MDTQQRTTGAPGWRELRQQRIARERKEALARRRERGRSPVRRPREEDDDEPRVAKATQARAGAAPARGAKPRIGFLRGSHIERAFVLLLYTVIGVLVCASVIGTMYGLHGEQAPVDQATGAIDIGTIWAAVAAGGARLWVAVGIQAALSILQYGARQMARHDARWWLLYVAALGISVYYNIQAYYTPLLAYVAPGTDYALIVACDVLPEFMAVRHD